MPAQPISTLLSWLLVAFTVEFDNEFEHLMIHSTTNHGSNSAAPWLASMAMYLTCLKYVPREGVRVAQLADLARTGTNLHGMARWRYITVGPDPADPRPKPPKSDWLIRPTAAGLKAREVWPPLFGVVEERWEMRFGKERIEHLRSALCSLLTQIPFNLPDFLPIQRHGLFTKGHIKKQPAVGNCHDKPLPTLLSQALICIAVRFEEGFGLPLSICANVLRVLHEEETRLRDLPALSGVSKEAISMALGILQKRNLALMVPAENGGRGKVAGLTPEGMQAQAAYRQTLLDLEERIATRFSRPVITNVGRSLEAMTADLSLLFAGMDPYPENWRASVPRPKILPHYPMILHRGGYPDGS